MEALFKLNTNDLSDDFVNKLKTLFPNFDVEIKFKSEIDETAFILNNPDFANELKLRIGEVEKSQNFIMIKESELL